MPAHLVTGYGGVEHVTAADDGSKNAGIAGIESYVLNTGSKFEAEVISSNLIKIKDGDAIQKGRHWRIAKNDYVECTIDNGLQGLKRNDLIVSRYSKNPDTGIESEEIVVIKGTSSENPANPEYETGDIYDGDLVDEMPLYRVELDGLNIISVTPLFKEISSLSELMDIINDNESTQKSFNDTISEKINSHIATVASNTVSGHVKVDNALSSTSKNPVQNNVVNTALLKQKTKSTSTTVKLLVKRDGTVASETVTVPDGVKNSDFILVICSCDVPATPNVSSAHPAVFTLKGAGVGDSSPYSGSTQAASTVSLIAANTESITVTGRIIATTTLTDSLQAAAWKAQYDEVTVGVRFIGI